MTSERATTEQTLADELARWHRAQHGTTPERIDVKLSGDLAIVRSRGIWTAAEREILTDEEGRRMITTARREHRSLTRDETHLIVGEALGCEVIRSFFDIDGRIGESCEIYVLEANLDHRFTFAPLVDSGR